MLTMYHSHALTLDEFALFIFFGDMCLFLMEIFKAILLKRLDYNIKTWKK